MPEPLYIGSLFSGIGGFEVGLQRVKHPDGSRAFGPVLYQAESDKFCRGVLARHWPHTKRFEDVRQVTSTTAEWAHLIVGGFPCTDVSYAGKGAGLDGAQSGLWSEMHRVICECRPRYVLIENVSALVDRGLERVLCDLASVGFDALWFPLRASDLGAPHNRRRIFVVAWRGEHRGRGLANQGATGTLGATLAHAGVARRQEHKTARIRNGQAGHHAHGCDACSPFGWPPRPKDRKGWAGWQALNGPEPGICRDDARVSKRAHRLKALGNSVMPAQAQLCGEVIAALERERAHD